MGIGRAIIAAVVALVAVGGIWSQMGRVGDAALAQVRAAAQLAEIGADAGRGNLLGVQPWLTPLDYANSATLEAALDSYLRQAREAGWLSGKSVVVFPEYAGTWLVAAGEKRSALEAKRADRAFGIIVASNLPRVLPRLLSAPAGVDRARWALFSMKAGRMAEDYQEVFGNLARRYGVTVVAGSIILPDPRVEMGRIVVTPGGHLRNVSAVFAPDGSLHAPLVIKAFPIDSELPFVSAGDPAAIPVFDTPAGRLGVLVCADAWYPESYAALRAKGAQLLAVPSYSSGDGLWSTPWGGYNGAAAPGDVDPGDVGRLTEGQAWMRYAVPGRAPDAGIAAGINVFLRGELWDLGSDGATIHVAGGKGGVERRASGAVLTNLWL